MSFVSSPNVRLPRVALRGFVLFVDPRPPQTSALMRALLTAGAQLEGVNDCATALEVVRANPDRISLVVVAHQPPAVDAVVLARELRQQGFRGDIGIAPQPGGDRQSIDDVLLIAPLRPGDLHQILAGAA